jgi:hypothetical protein
VRPHPSYSPEEKARQREISPTYSSDASNACTPRKGSCPENPPSSFFAHARAEVLNAMVMAVVEEWDADYGIKIVYRREDIDDYRMPPARQSYFKPTGAGTSRYSTCDDLSFSLLRILSANAQKHPTLQVARSLESFPGSPLGPATGPRRIGSREVKHPHIFRWSQHSRLSCSCTAAWA